MPPKKNSPEGMELRRQQAQQQAQALQQALQQALFGDVFVNGLPMGATVGATRNPRGPRPRPEPRVRDPTHSNAPGMIRLRTIQGQITPEMRAAARAAREAAGANLPPHPAPPGWEEFKQGGKVKKTGLALVHKGEVVVPATRVKTVDRALKQAGLKPLKK